MERVNSKLFLGRPFNKLVVFNCICKKNWFCSFQKEKFHSFQSAITHSQSFNASLLCTPQVSLTDAPFLGASGGDQYLLLPIGLGSAWGLAPGPYLILWPFLVSWSIPQWVQSGLGLPESWNAGPKETLEHHQVVCPLVHLGVPSLQPGWAPTPTAQGAGMVGISLGPPEMLQKPSPTLGELENSGLLHSGL